ncbi:MAG: class I SAM-dependent methyltransferase [Chloroflexi bacterium]|nr:class I SAM-dependent methyltransferase [Chloroflexota bacterium]
MHKDARAFDALAGEYDSRFTHTQLGRMLRARVWEWLGRLVGEGECVLELACGTGEDAVWLARRGAFVTATDGSPQMLAAAREKVQAAGLQDKVTFARLDLAALDPAFDEGMKGRGDGGLYDAAFSNFGGLNVLHNWRPLAEFLAGKVRVGGWVMLVVMGPVCPWEMLWHLAHAQPRRAFRRLRQPAMFRADAHTTIPIWYPSARRLRRDFAPWFEHFRTESLGFWLPPGYLAHLVQRHPRSPPVHPSRPPRPPHRPLVPRLGRPLPRHSSQERLKIVYVWSPGFRWL